MAEESNVTGVNKTIASANLTATGEDVDLEESFEPTVVNTLVYVLILAMQASTVAVCYKGAPFMEGLLKRRSLVIL